MLGHQCQAARECYGHLGERSDYNDLFDFVAFGLFDTGLDGPDMSERESLETFT